MAPLSRLVGMSLIAVDHSGEFIGLVFDSCTLSSFSPHRSSVPFQDMLDVKVAAVSCEPGKSLCIRFSGGEEFEVSLASDDYTGPEAFAAHFSDGTLVVE